MKKSFNEQEFRAWFDEFTKYTWYIHDGGGKVVSRLPYLISTAPGSDVADMAQRFYDAAKTMMDTMTAIQKELDDLRKWN